MDVGLLALDRGGSTARPPRRSQPPVPTRGRSRRPRACRGGNGADVAVISGEHFYADGADGSEVHLCFSSVPAPRIEEGVRRLGATMGEIRTDPARLEVAQVLA